jgi:hypothetical protein
MVGHNQVFCDGGKSGDPLGPVGGFCCPGDLSSWAFSLHNEDIGSGVGKMRGWEVVPTACPTIRQN